MPAIRLRQETLIVVGKRDLAIMANEHVSEFSFLGGEVTAVRCIVPRDQGNTRLDDDPDLLQRRHLARIVRHEPQGICTQDFQNRLAYVVEPEIRREAQALVGLDRVGPPILQLIGANLVGQPDPPPFLTQVDQETATLRGDIPQGGFQLRPAVAALAEQTIAGQTLRVHPGQDRRAIGDVAQGHCHMLLAGQAIDKAVQTKIGPRCREIAGADVFQRRRRLPICRRFRG